MINRVVGIAAICVVVAQGLLLPPDTDYNDDLFSPAVNPKSRSIQIPCSSCEFPSSETDSEEDLEGLDQTWLHSNYELNLSFDVSTDGQRLRLNNEAIYPGQYLRDAYIQGRPLYVNQLSPSGIVTPLEVTSSGVKIESESPISVDGDSIVKLKFQIMALEWRLVPGLPEVAIDVLRRATGELFIVTVDLEKAPVVVPVPIPPAQPATPSDANNCGFMPLTFCELKDRLLESATTVRHKLESERPWNGHLPTHFRTHFGCANTQHGSDDRSSHSHRYDLTSPYRQHHHVHSFVRGLIAVLIPILAGITVGLLVSFLGLLVGRTIGCLWIRFARGGRRGSAGSALYRDDFDEGKILMADDDIEPLPIYERAPPYEEFEKRSR